MFRLNQVELWEQFKHSVRQECPSPPPKYRRVLSATRCVVKQDATRSEAHQSEVPLEMPQNEAPQIEAHQIETFQNETPQNETPQNEPLQNEAPPGETRLRKVQINRESDKNILSRSKHENTAFEIDFALPVSPRKPSIVSQSPVVCSKPTTKGTKTTSSNNKKLNVFILYKVSNVQFVPLKQAKVFERNLKRLGAVVQPIRRLQNANKLVETDVLLVGSDKLSSYEHAMALKLVAGDASKLTAAFFAIECAEHKKLLDPSHPRFRPRFERPKEQVEERTRRKQKMKRLTLEKALVCQKFNDGSYRCRNQQLVDVFDEMSLLYEVRNEDKDVWRSNTCKKVAGILRRYPRKIKLQRNNGDDDFQRLRKIRGISGETIKKIKEILETGSHLKLETLRSSKELRQRRELLGIWGVGPSTARKWQSQGIRSIGDVRKQHSKGKLKLSRMQQIGVQHYEDMQKKIPRCEIDAFRAIVERQVQRLCPGAIVVVCGSYRRGKPSSGDMDFLITHPNPEALFAHYPQEDTSDILGHSRGVNSGGLKEIQGVSLLYRIVRALSPSVLSGHILSSDKFDLNDVQQVHEYLDDDHVPHWTYMGMAKLPRQSFEQLRKLHPRMKLEHRFRRFDMKVYEPSVFPFALLYFTGSDHFNRSMRYFAKRQLNMSMSDKGLYHAIRNSKRDRIARGKSVVCKSERAIFEVLGLDYVPPRSRNAYDSWSSEGGASNLMRFDSEMQHVFQLQHDSNQNNGNTSDANDESSSSDSAFGGSDDDYGVSDGEWERFEVFADVISDQHEANKNSS
ncbi:MAG: hypothetical protein MHM6MM_003441 [Cercozoa sp. M6MM]